MCLKPCNKNHTQSGCCQAQRDTIALKQVQQRIREKKGKSKVICSTGFQMHDYSN